MKKALMYPRTVYMRRKHRQLDGFARSAIELHYYRPAIFRFFGATFFKPDILVDMDLGANASVVDVGAYVGDWAQKIVERYGATVFSFEPNPDSFRSLQQKSLRFPGIKPFDYGLGAVSEEVELTLHGLGSSVYENRAMHASVPRAVVRIRAIEQVWRELDFGAIDLMKINIEGAEFPLLQRMIQTGLIDRVDCYLIQFHEWHPGAYRKRARIRRELAKTHRLEWDYHFVWEKWVRRID